MRVRVKRLGYMGVPANDVVTRVVFVEPSPTAPNLGHMNVMNGALHINASLFCVEMVEAALAWRDTVAGSEPNETNVKQLVTRYPNRLSPYISGLPVIS